MSPSMLSCSAISLAVLAACATAGRTASPSLEEIYWRLVELNGRPAVNNAGELRAHLRFTRDSARVVGSTGCNRLTGTFTRNGTTLRFGPTATTRMACLDSRLNVQERTLLAALQGTARHEVAGDTLSLIGPSGVLARFVAGSP
jgi:heat shock protein HslJ